MSPFVDEDNVTNHCPVCEHNAPRVERLLEALEEIVKKRPHGDYLTYSQIEEIAQSALAGMEGVNGER